jgi:hypothetical protein
VRGEQDPALRPAQRPFEDIHDPDASLPRWRRLF